MAAITIIPARLDSKRYPRKLVEHKVSGKPLIQHIFELSFAQRDTYITCSSKDAETFLDYVPESNIILSSDVHINGTSRVREAAEKLTPIYGHDFIVINLQGDNLNIPNLNFVPFYDLKNFVYSFYYINQFDCYSGNTKCVLNESDGTALWFSRQDIKYLNYRYHIGTYIYRLSTLRKLPAIENYESLEQNSWLAAGFKIKMVENEEIHSVDFPS